MLKRNLCNLPKNPTYSFDEFSFESRLFYWFEQLDMFLYPRTRYAYFGGTAVAAYIGHLPRRLHDIDLIICPSETVALEEFLTSKGFVIAKGFKPIKANYRKYTLRNHVWDIIISSFPGKFILLDVSEDNVPVTGEYDFAPALRYSQRRTIRSLGGTGSVDVQSIPIEDLIISKLWPTFEPDTVHDLTMLLSSNAIQKIDHRYLKARIKDAATLKSKMAENLRKFSKAYHISQWVKVRSNNDSISEAITYLLDYLKVPIHEKQHLTRE